MTNRTGAEVGRKLVLVDAYSLLFRAYFGGRYLSTSDNRPTGALFGFAGMLFTVLSNEKPDAMVVCWDAHQQTHRSREFEAYKAHRPEADPQLKAQLPIARDLVAAFGIQSAEVGGYEADDLIGTLASHGARDGYSVTILTGDTDQLQLVGDGVTVQMTQRGVTELRAYDHDAVVERYGIEPNRIPDWKALVGDTSDNIPGVPGIGDKTATLLLQQFETLETLLERVADVAPPRAKAALEANAEQARLSKRLATIVCDVPAELRIEPYAPTEEDWARLRDLFTELEFRSLLTRIPQTVGRHDAPKGDAAPFTFNFSPIGSKAELDAALARVRANGAVAIQLHATGSQPISATLHGIAFAPTSEAAYYVAVTTPRPAMIGGLFDGESEDAAPPTEEANIAGFSVPLSALDALFTDVDLQRFSHNAKFCEEMAERFGIATATFAFDTLIAAYLLNSGRSSYPLADLAATHLGSDAESIVHATDEQKTACEAAIVQALVDPMRAALEQLGMTRVMNEVDLPLVPILSNIELTGILVDKAYLSTLATRMGSELEDLSSTIYSLAGGEFSIGSTKQLQTILFDRLKLPTGKKTKTGYSTGADLLEQLAVDYPIARRILEWRETSKLKSTYADSLPRLINPVTGRIHTSLNQTVASTGRLSSSDPNLQNIPIRSEAGREIRRGFIAPKGKVLLSCDYSQIELRVLAHIAEDETLVSAFLEDQDIHSATAATVFGVELEDVTPDQRRQAKTINFAVIYGQSGFALAATLGVDVATANNWIKEYFKRLPGVQRYVDETTALAHHQRYVSTLLGRRRYVPEIESGNHAMRQGAERAAVNMPIQGTAADIMKLAMIHVAGELKNGGSCTLILQVHDELLFEVEAAAVKPVAARMREIMEAAYPLNVQLRTDAKYGPNWSEMRPVSI